MDLPGGDRMNTFWILLEQIGLFVIYIIIGALLIKTKVFTEITIESISSIETGASGYDLC